jgi:hypothetical protein
MQNINLSKCVQTLIPILPNAVGIDCYGMIGGVKFKCSEIVVRFAAIPAPSASTGIGVCKINSYIRLARTLVIAVHVE